MSLVLFKVQLIGLDICYFYAITYNDNLPEIIEKYGSNSRKISCDFYIDDKAISGYTYKLFE